MTTDAEKEVSKLVLGMRWAVTSTNIIGMPLLIPVIGIIVNLTFGNIQACYHIDPLFIVVNLGLILSVAGFFVELHFQLVTRIYLAPVFKYLRERERTKGEQARRLATEALQASLRFPYLDLAFSILFYVIGVTVLLLALNLIFYSFAVVQNIMLLASAITTGTLISFFQLFTSRSRLNPIVDQILAEHPEFTRDERFNKVVLGGIRVKLLVAVVILSAALVSLTGIVAYSESNRNFHIQMGLFYRGAILRVENKITSMVENNSPKFERENFMKNILLHEEDSIFMVDNTKQSLLTSEPDDKWKRIIGILMDKAIFKLELHRPIVMRISDQDVYTVVLDQQMYIVTRISLAAGQATVFAVDPVSTNEAGTHALALLVIIAIGVTLLLSTLYARFASNEINYPLTSIINSIRQVAEGNLGVPVRVVSQDELGFLALNQARTVETLRNVMSRITEATSSLEKATDQISGQNQEVQSGAQIQGKSVEDTTVSMREMNQSIQEIANSIETLAHSAEESSASILEVGVTIEQVAANVENLSLSVEQTTSSIQEMTASIREVADNVQQLTRRSGEAISSFHEIENAIESVGKSANDTAHLTEKVAADAVQSAQAVEMTIAGIGKIRETSQQALEVITSLSRRVASIGNILNVIEDVTEETNLLALNAAIIAAQAGEHGRGFAVVADEIKDMAERTVVSTKEISEVIQTVQDEAKNALQSVVASSKNVEDGVKLSEEAGLALREILRSAGESQERTREIAKTTSLQSERAKQVMSFFEGVKELINQIAVATQEQNRGGDQIYRAAMEMESIAQQVKRATREQAKGSRQITQSIENISQVVGFINTAQNEQLKNSRNVLGSMQQIREVVEQNTRHVGDMATAVENLKFLAEDLREMIGKFKVQTEQVQKVIEKAKPRTSQEIFPPKTMETKTIFTLD